MNTKNALFCHSNSVQKYGTRNHKQCYFCTQCKRCFNGGIRLNNDELWQQYHDEHRTIE
ncbi:transposase-like zinc-binding domain-containing protein, partial [Kingella negevensis]|uniref:transposase-like zinc-binding domain-containing protein n=1 Tax=Kingella negevensis TaxID=1522312 RepID=UPI003D6E5EE2